MSEDHHDLMVVGGGIHGADVALAATAPGHSVLVLEFVEVGKAPQSAWPSAFCGCTRRNGAYPLRAPIPWISV